MRFADFVEINPKVNIKRREIYPCVMMADINPGNRYITASENRVFKGGSVFNSDDTLFARITPCLENGKIAQYKGLPAFGSTEFIVFRGKEGISDSDFIYYLSLTDDIRQPAEKSMFGASGRQRADLSVIRDIEIFPPDLPIQRKIASILSAYDDLIENNERRIRILEEMAQAIYREWFVHFRYPGHENVPLVDSPLGSIPEGWKCVKLKSVVDINPTSIKQNDKFDFINYVDISSVSTGTIDKIDKILFKQAPSRARRIVKHGDIIWSTVRPNRKSFCLIINPIENLIVSTGFAVLRTRSIPFSYIYFTTTTDIFIDYLTNHATGAAYPAVNTNDFEKANILLPPLRLMKMFHNVINTNIFFQYVLKKKNQNLRTQRDLLLPRLISGELDVSDLHMEGISDD